MKKKDPIKMNDLEIGMSGSFWVLNRQKKFQFFFDQEDGGARERKKNEISANFIPALDPTNPPQTHLKPHTMSTWVHVCIFARIPS